MSQLLLSALALYPVKSLRGFSLDSALLTPYGLQWDRYWMIINEANRFISQRQIAAMVLIKTRLTQSHLILSKEGMDDLNIALSFSGSEEPISATVWKDECQVISEGEQASQWLGQALSSSVKLRLVRMANKHQRPQSKPDLLGASTTTHFADAAPFLICNPSSLEALNQGLLAQGEQPAIMEQFRPNIVLSGLEPFAEHDIQELGNKDYGFKLCYPCQRCAIPTINVETAIKDPHQQPFRRLAEINPMPDNPKAPAFGENAILLSGANQTISVNDRLSSQ